MIRYRLTILLIYIISIIGIANAQSSSTTTRRIVSGTSLPATCTVGGNNIFYRSDLGTLYTCTATNVWTVVAGGGAGTGTVTHTVGALTLNQLVFGNGGADVKVGDLSGDVSTSGGTATIIGALKVTNGMLAGSIAASKLVGTDIATVGTITTGGWQGTAVATGFGGTGQAVYTDGQLLIGNTATGGLSKATLTAGANIAITNGNGTITITGSGGGGITNTAGANVITKSDGTNIVASTLTDDGTTVTTSATGGIVPSTNNTKNLGSTTAKWAAGYINQIFFNPPSLANGDRIAYAAGTGPFFSDDTTGFNLSFNVQSLTLTRTVTWPNASGTIFYNSRLINTTSPITGGGDLSADRTIACATCTTNAAALTANLPVIGAGSNAIAVGTRSGNTTQFVTTTGTLTSGDCVKIDASGNFIANGSACGGSGSVANPTATIGLTAVNGVAASAIRSDGAPALSQSIAPTWTGQHIWSLSNAAAVSIGPNGDTNPALRLVTNVASAATGFSVTGNAAGSGATLTVLSSGTNEDAIINPKGSGALSVGGSGTATIKPTDASGTNIAGSDQIIIQGLGTGNASPGLYRVQGGALSTSSGTTLQTAIDRHVVGRPFVLANNTATTVINVTDTSGSAAAVVIDYAVEITNGTDYQVEEGQISCHVTNKAGTIANNTCTKYGNQQAATAGTLTVTWTITAANPALVQVNANSSLTPSTGFPRLVYSVKNLTNQAIAAQ